jgi:hypothetical protein
MTKKVKTKHKTNAVAPRLSDEDIDPIEQDETENSSMQVVEGWLPWEPEDIADIQKLITEKMGIKQKFVIEAFLDGQNYHQINVTEKYWRYHFAKGVEFIKKELGI